MDTISYKGKTYVRYSSKWSNEDGMIANPGLQMELNHLYAQSLDLSGTTAKEAIAQGDKFKFSSSFACAIRYYEHAITVATTVTQVSYILPRITSCYRKQGQAKKAIQLFTYAKETYGDEIFNAPLLTSAAAAYCDLGDYESALKCSKKAYLLSGGAPGDEWFKMQARIKQNI